jgi:hypothetical protein
MPGDARTDPGLEAGVRLPSAPRVRVRGPGAGQGDDVGALAQAISGRLLSAGLDLNSALMRCGDGPASAGLWHAVAELDEAITDLRRLVLAVPGPAAGAGPDGGQRD